MSCLLEFKVAATLIGDEGEDYICNHLNERNHSFVKRMMKKPSEGINKFIRKYILRQIL